MKSYKDFKKVCLGISDIAQLIVRGPEKVEIVRFDYDGCYYAYECFGDVEIPPYYQKVFSGVSWLRIYDDNLCAYKSNEWSTGCRFVDVYRGGPAGCIIHWHN